MRGPRHRLLLVVAAALATRHARAQSGPFATSSLSWVRLPGAEGCVSGAELAREVERRLRRSVFVSVARADVAVEGRIEPSPSPPGRGWRATLVATTSDGRTLGSRELQSDAASCRALDASLALVVALMIDPEAASQAAPPPTAPPPPTPPPVRATPAPSAAPPRRATPPARRTEVELTVAAALNLGLLPHPAGGAALVGLIDPPVFVPIEVGASVWPHDRLEVAGVGSTFLAAEGRLALCPTLFRRDRVRLAACGGVHVGVVRADPLRPEDPPVPDQALVDLGVSARLSVRIVGPLVVYGAAGVVAALIQPRYFYNAGGTMQFVFQRWPVAVPLELGLGLRLP